MKLVVDCRDHSGYGFSQWAEALLCNSFCHWMNHTQNDPWILSLRSPQWFRFIMFMASCKSCNKWTSHYQNQCWLLHKWTNEVMSIWAFQVHIDFLFNRLLRLTTNRHHMGIQAFQITPTTWLFVQQIAEGNNKETIKVPQYWPIVLCWWIPCTKGQ